MMRVTEKNLQTNSVAGGAQLNNLEQLLSLSGNSVLLAVSDASARQWRDKLAELRRQQGAAFVETVAVMPVDQWLAGLWDSSFPDRQVLRPVQLLALARQLIESSELFPRQCLNPLAICRQFVDAFQLFHSYQLSDSREHYLFSTEYQAFYRWQQRLQQRLDEQQALASSQLPAALRGLLDENPRALDLPRQLIICEGLELLPAQAAFIQACRQHTELHGLQGAVKTRPELLLAQFAKRRDECRAVAAALATRLQASDPAAPPRLAVVCADPQAYRGTLTEALRQQLYPASLLPLQQQDREQPLCEPWLFEGVEKLLGFPLISAAWDLISLSAKSASLEQLSRVLRSRFISGWPQWRSERARLDLHWREQLSAQTSLGQALTAAKTFNKLESPELVADILAPMAQLQAYLQSLPTAQLPSAWVRSFDQLLILLGWPNAELDDAVVVQCRRGFSQAMDVFRAMDRQLGAISHTEAISWLQHILGTKRFSISRNWVSPILIMGIDEALGREFDALFLLGCDDASLPRLSDPSPFLPLSLQQRAGLPGSSPGQQLQSEAATLARLLATAPEVYLSYCGESDEGVGQQLSSLLLPCAEQFRQWPEPASTSSPCLINGKLKTAEQEQVAAVSESERQRLRGGSGLFKEYALSPFFAFAKYRLGLKEFPQPLEGLDHRLQGIVVHNSLQYFWEKTRDKRGLDSLGEQALAERVLACVEQAFKDREVAAWRFPLALIEIERQRVAGLVSSWLIEKEKPRLDHFTVLAVEQARRAELLGIKLNLRLDRIDQVETADGPKRLVIDYKTGSVDGKSLNSDQLSEPQLPIYALVEGESNPVDGIMLAQLKVGDLKLHMRSNWANSVIAKRAGSNDVASREAWQNELQAWSTALTDMAGGILSGDIRHDASRDHRRGFSAYLLPLLRGEDLEEAGE